MLPVHLVPFLPLGASHPKGRAKERQFGCLMLKDKWEKRSQGFTAYCGLSLGIPSLFLDFNLQRVVYYCCFSLNSNIF